MTYEVITNCPVCDRNLKVTKLSCDHCGVSCQGRFTLDKFSYLTKEEKGFIEVFLCCRGNIKDVEKVLGISYPTVRNRLDKIVERLGYKSDVEPIGSVSAEETLALLEKGEIDVEEAIKRIKK